jgi:hypothetical protein
MGSSSLQRLCYPWSQPITLASRVALMKRYGDDAMLKAAERDEDDIVGASYVALA